MFNRGYTNPWMQGPGKKTRVIQKVVGLAHGTFLLKSVKLYLHNNIALEFLKICIVCIISIVSVADVLRIQIKS